MPKSAKRLMRLVFFGTPLFAIPSLERLLSIPHTLLAVVTQPDRPKGRHLKLTPPPVKSYAQERNLPILQPQKANDPKLLETLFHLKPDLFIVISYGQILPKPLLELPRLFSLGLHPSLLPRYRGAAPIPWTVLNREKETGVTILRINERVDAGDILLQRSTIVDGSEDTMNLAQRLAQMGAELLIEGLDLIEGGKANFTVQDEAQATYARRLTKEDGRIDWERPAEEICAQVRALVPWPSTYAFYKGQRIGIWQAQVERRPAYGRVGQILRIRDPEGISVSTGKEIFILKQIQPQDRNQMSAIEFSRGYRVRPGDVLG